MHLSIHYSAAWRCVTVTLRSAMMCHVNPKSSLPACCHVSSCSCWSNSCRHYITMNLVTNVSHVRKWPGGLVPAHSDFEGNEKADILAKNGCLKGDFTNLELPVPQATWKSCIHLQARKEAEERWEASPASHFKTMWREKFQAEVGSLNRGELRIATQLLIGHAGVNYHLHKYKPHIISKTCPFCQCGDETVSHYLGSCPRWARLRAQYLNTYYDSSSTIMDNTNLKNIINFAKASRRLDTDFESPDRLQDLQPHLWSPPPHLTVMVLVGSRTFNRTPGRARGLAPHLTYTPVQPLRKKEECILITRSAQQGFMWRVGSHDEWVHMTWCVVPAPDRNSLRVNRIQKFQV